MERTSPTSEDIKPTASSSKEQQQHCARSARSRLCTHERSFILHGDRNTSQNNSPGPKYFTMTERQGQPHDTVTDPSPTITPIPDRTPHPASSLPPTPPSLHPQLPHDPLPAPPKRRACRPIQLSPVARAKILCGLMDKSALGTALPGQLRGYLQVNDLIKSTKPSTRALGYTSCLVFA